MAWLANPASESKKIARAGIVEGAEFATILSLQCGTERARDC
jgi:hypothetical protein